MEHRDGGSPRCLLRMGQQEDLFDIWNCPGTCGQADQGPIGTIPRGDAVRLRMNAYTAGPRRLHQGRIELGSAMLQEVGPLRWMCGNQGWNVAGHVRLALW
jgi:hypothetical protein